MSFSSQKLGEASLVGYWRLGESSGTLADASPSANDATGIGGITYSATSLIHGDTSNTAITLSGSSSGATIGNVSELDFDGDSGFSVECIIKPSNVSAYAPIIGKVASPDQGWEVAVYNTHIQVSINYNNGGGWHQVSSNTTLSTGTVYYVTVLYRLDGTDREVDIYINGVFDNTTSFARGTGTMATSASAAIGHRPSAGTIWYAGDLDEVAVYDETLSLTQLHQHLALALATKDGTQAAWGTTPKLIIDTDCANDPGDPGALAVACALANRGECQILAFVVDTATADIPECVDVISYYYGQRTQAIGKRTSGSPESGTNAWVNYLPDNFPTSRGSYADAVNVYRQALHDASDASVTMVSIGFMGVIRDLMVSASDGIDSRNGMDLIAAKVLRLVVMGGHYTGSGAEYNFAQEPSATTGASYVVANWSSSIPIYFSGYELGVQILAGSGLAATPVSNPVRYVYNDTGYLGTGREAWDETAILFAVRNQYYSDAYYWTLTRGTNSVNGTTGDNTFTPGGGGPHYYLTLKAPAALMSTVLDALTAADPPGFGTRLVNGSILIRGRLMQ